MEFSIVQLIGDDRSTDNPVARYVPESLLKRKDMSLLGALEPEGRLVGALVFCVENGMIRITSLQVDEIYRREGVGTALLDTMTAIAEEQLGSYPLEAYYPDDAEHEAFTQLLLSRGNFLIDKVPCFYRIEKEGQKPGGMYEKLLLREAKGELFYELPERIREAFLNKLLAKGINSMQMRWDEEDYDKELCFCKRRGGSVTAAVFIRSRNRRHLKRRCVHELLRELVPTRVSAFGSRTDRL